jgi:LTXXQ motif family protein
MILPSCFPAASLQPPAPSAVEGLRLCKDLKEILMLKGVVGLAAVLAVAGSAQAQEAQYQAAQKQAAQNQEAQIQEAPHHGASHQDASHRLSQADLNALTDIRIGMARDMLQMTPQQAQFWPPIEETIRNNAEARYRRIAQRRAMPDQAGENESDPVAIMRSRAETLSARGARLKELADVLQPLCQTLTPEQKDGMRLVASYVLRETRGAMGRRGERADPDEED